MPWLLAIDEFPSSTLENRPTYAPSDTKTTATALTSTSTSTTPRLPRLSHIRSRENIDRVHVFSFSRHPTTTILYHIEICCSCLCDLYCQTAARQASRKSPRFSPPHDSFTKLSCDPISRVPAIPRVTTPRHLRCEVLRPITRPPEPFDFMNSSMFWYSQFNQ